MLSSKSAREPASLCSETSTPALAAAMPAEIFPKSHTGWISWSSVWVKTRFQERVLRLTSGELVLTHWLSLRTP
jgi:hypothetical protein